MSIVFSGTAGVAALFGTQSWPTPMILVAVLVLPLAMRSAEARGTMGVEAVGQALLHVLVVTQVGLAAVLLNLVPTVMAGLVALAFYTWAGAVEALRDGRSGRSVAIEFGSLVLLGLIVGLLMYRP
jgi:lipopolysaccharide export LptBFGC system permease protein LptF